MTTKKPSETSFILTPLHYFQYSGNTFPEEYIENDPLVFYMAIPCHATESVREYKGASKFILKFNHTFPNFSASELEFQFKYQI